MSNIAQFPGKRQSECTTLRLNILKNGFQPAPVCAPGCSCKSPGKVPHIAGWQKGGATAVEILSWESRRPKDTNTGILCDGLRVLDFDIDDPAKVEDICSFIDIYCGATIVRTRQNSPRCALVFRAEEGQPRKRILSGKHGKIEVLGKGNQFAAYGQHHSGATLTWRSGSPESVRYDDLIGLSEDDVTRILQYAARVIEADLPADAGTLKSDRDDDLRGEPDWARMRSALEAIPPEARVDRDSIWMPIMMAIHHETGGSEEGYALCDEWSQVGFNYDEKEQRKAWDSLGKNPREARKVGTLYHIARQNGWGLELLSLTNWRVRDLPRPERLLGDIITSGARVFLFGPTGLGKTNLSLGMAAAMATGKGLGRWQASRPCRVLFIDGEMPRDLVQDRLRDLMEREPDPGARARMEANLFVLCNEDFPELEPLNTDAGRAFILEMIGKLARLDVVFFDNRMSLSSGDMKEEEPWTNTLPLVSTLSQNRIAQIWVDHTGINETRGYGTKTKEWRFDSVILLSKCDRPEADLAFKLEFTKARRRRPDNRTDFDPVVLSLSRGTWTVEDAPVALSKSSAEGSTYDRLALRALVTVIAKEGQRLPKGDGFPDDVVMGVNRDVWRRAFYNLIPAVSEDLRRKNFGRAVASLTDKEEVSTNLNWVWISAGGQEAWEEPGHGTPL